MTAGHTVKKKREKKREIDCISHVYRHIRFADRLTPNVLQTHTHHKVCGKTDTIRFVDKLSLTVRFPDRLTLTLRLQTDRYVLQTDRLSP